MRFARHRDGVAQNFLLLEPASHASEGVGEGYPPLAGPADGRPFGPLRQRGIEQRHHAVESQQTGGLPGHRQLPVPTGRPQSQVGTTDLKRGVDVPATGIQADDRPRQRTLR